mgnify:CR=1 FL=1
MILSVEQRDEILSELNSDQREFLSSQMVRGRRTAFANAMANQKGHHIPPDADPEEIESLLKEWVYIGYIDAGSVSAELRCECGRPLRYQHHVEHKTTGDIKKFGIEHLKEHLSIDAATVAVIKKGFDAIDYELDELLLKVRNKWQIDPQLLQVEELPQDITEHLKRGLPLLERQLKRLRQLNVRPANMPAPIPPSLQNNKPDEGYDLLSWNEPPKRGQNLTFDLPVYLQEPARQYLMNGVNSARIIAELLLTEHQAPDSRYITGKPHIYLPLCNFLESLPHVSLVSSSAEDRSYQYQKPAQ